MKNTKITKLVNHIFDNRLDRNETIRYLEIKLNNCNCRVKKK